MLTVENLSVRKNKANILKASHAYSLWILSRDDTHTIFSSILLAFHLYSLKF